MKAALEQLRRTDLSVMLFARTPARGQAER